MTVNYSHLYRMGDSESDYSSWEWAPGQLAVSAWVLILPQIEATCHGWWWPCKSPPSECYTDGAVHSSDLFPSSLRTCLSLFLSLDLWSMWHGMAKTCPSLRKAIRCTPGWWWLCWTRTENGKRWASFCMLNAVRGRAEWKHRQRKGSTYSFSRHISCWLLQISTHDQE